MPNKSVTSNFNAIEGNYTLTYDTSSIATIFNNLFSNLVNFPLIKFPNSPDK